MSDRGLSAKTMIEILAQDKADAWQDQAMLTAHGAPAPGEAYRDVMARAVGDETMQKMDEWLEIARFETEARLIAKLFYEWTTGDCSMTYETLYGLCMKHMELFAELLVSIGIVTPG